MAFTLESPAFSHEGSIPSRFTCDGENISPALVWRDAPAEAKSFALLCDDPDAPRGTFVHWVLYGLPAAATGLPESVPPEPRLDSGARQGKNSGGGTGYMGPCPPSGTHRYYFTLYALATVPELPSGASKEQLLTAIRGQILAETQLMGRYARKAR